MQHCCLFRGRPRPRLALVLVLALTAAVLAATAPPAAGQGFVPTPVVRSGDNAPGTPAGVTFGLPPGTTDPSTVIGPAINSSGTVALIVHVTGSGVTANVNDSGIWTGTAGGGVQLVARDGDPAPIGSGASAPLAQINSFPAINAAGLVGFRGTLAVGGGVTTANDTGVWAKPAGRPPALVARGGGGA